MFYRLHQFAEQRALILAIFILLTVSVGGIVQIVPLFAIENTIERVQGMRPYTPLELIGRNIYIREGCYACHSQQIRPLRDEVERYGHYSLAAESMYDHPFQWGSKRTGPDLARIGGRYSNEWHVAHLVDPQSVVPPSVMPSYAFLLNKRINTADIADHLRANRAVGVPYTDEMVANAQADVLAQSNPAADTTDLLVRYPKAAIGNLDGSPASVTEMDAVVAYLQILGRMVDFTDVRLEDLTQ